MPTVPLHPALVHVPLGLAFVLPLVAIGLALALWRGLVPRRAWLVMVVLQAVLVAGAGAALWTGDADEKRVKPLVGERALDAHEDAGAVFLWAAGGVLAVALAGLALPRRWGAAAAATAAAGTLIVAGLGYRTGKAGGELVYARGAASAYTGGSDPGSASVANAVKHERDRHDE